VQTILSPQFGQNFQSDLTSKPHFLHFTIAAMAGIFHPPFLITTALARRRRSE
jgi:hypothetical protein